MNGKHGKLLNHGHKAVLCQLRQLLEFEREDMDDGIIRTRTNTRCATRMRSCCVC